MNYQTPNCFICILYSVKLRHQTKRKVYSFTHQDHHSILLTFGMLTQHQNDLMAPNRVHLREKLDGIIKNLTSQSVHQQHHQHEHQYEYIYIYILYAYIYIHIFIYMI